MIDRSSMIDSTIGRSCGPNIAVSTLRPTTGPNDADVALAALQGSRADRRADAVALAGRAERVTEQADRRAS